MKKLFFILFFITAHTYIHTMETVKNAVHYLSKRLDPDSYVLDNKNEELYESLQKKMEQNEVGELMRDESFILGIEKQSYERVYYLIQCLVSASKTQSHKNLTSMVEINLPIIPDLHLILAMKALKEHDKKMIETETEFADVNALLYRIKQQSQEKQKALKQALRVQEEILEVSQSLALVEQYLGTVPKQTRLDFLAKMVEQQKQQLDQSSSSPKSPETQGSSSSESPKTQEKLASSNREEHDNNNQQRLNLDSQDGEQF